MKKYSVLAGLLLLWFCHAQAGGAGGIAQTPPASAPAATPTPTPKQETRTARKTDASSLQKYVGRYALEAGVIPVSTLDVTLENGELWVKPSLVKRRRLVAQGRRAFRDELEGARYTFNRDDEGRINSLTFEFEGSSYTAQRIALPPPSLRGNTTFRLRAHADAQIVVVAGSFNNWDESQFLFAREGDEWVCRLDLTPGRYTYKFIVDGNWILDPANSETEEDAYGNLNSVLVLKPTP